MACKSWTITGRRSPHGERGLKWIDIRGGARHGKSLSSWRAWIEISGLLHIVTPELSRSPHGERGLKYNVLCLCAVYASRSPHGERGLKW